MRNWILISISLAFGLVACHSTPPGALPDNAPAWVTNPTRTMDSGYIVYVGKGEDLSFEKATFKAEAVAIGDVTNECSFAPKGARIEDRYDNFYNNVHHVYAKLGLTFEECEDAKRAITPEAIKPLANVAMAEQWKKYQDIYYSAGEEEVAENNTLPSPVPSGAPSTGYSSGGTRFVAIQSTPDYFILRQQIAYEKEVVILNPPNQPLPPASEGHMLSERLSGPTTQVATYEKSNPTMARTPLSWSQVQRDPMVKYPGGFRRDSTFTPHPMSSRQMGGAGGYRGNGNGNQKRQNYQRRRRRHSN